ncbi:hypothetical protein MCOR13_006522 [Pyricularia oryzae]|nr:hypothetical protein MCOR13_006522 [Pyricularia oryzae]
MVTQLSVKANKFPPANIFPYQHLRPYSKPAYLAFATFAAAMHFSTVMSAASSKQGKERAPPAGSA